MSDVKRNDELVQCIREWMRGLQVSKDFTFDDLIYVHMDYACFSYEYIKNGMKIRVQKEII